MKTLVGPLSRNSIVLCSADASPKSQQERPDKAGHFFSRAAWVGATRNSADRIGCHFVILTTGHGLVTPDEVISPYDLHIRDHPSQVAEKWRTTIPSLLAGRGYRLMVFYAGGCPRRPYVDVLRPILHSLGISLVTFGRPNMHDIGKIEVFTESLIKGTSVSDLAAILAHPERLEIYFHL